MLTIKPSLAYFGVNSFSSINWMHECIITKMEELGSFKGIVSRDFVVCFWCHLIYLKFVHMRSVFVCF
jgi:hypothetical protein